MLSVAEESGLVATIDTASPKTPAIRHSNRGLKIMRSI